MLTFARMTMSMKNDCIRLATRLLALWLTLAGTAAGPLKAQPTVSRADLAWRYLLMDANYSVADSTGRLTDSTRAALNRIFDRSTLSFFGGRFAVTAAMMDTAITMASPSYRYTARTLPTDVTIDGKPARVVRSALLSRLAAIDSTGPLAQAIVSAKARVAVLVDTVSAERSAEFVAEPAALAKAVSAEVKALEQGKNPYALCGRHLAELSVGGECPSAHAGDCAGRSGQERRRRAGRVAWCRWRRKHVCDGIRAGDRGAARA